MGPHGVCGESLSLTGAARWGTEWGWSCGDSRLGAHGGEARLCVVLPARGARRVQCCQASPSGGSLACTVSAALVDPGGWGEVFAVGGGSWKPAGGSRSTFGSAAPTVLSSCPGRPPNFRGGRFGRGEVFAVAGCRGASVVVGRGVALRLESEECSRPSVGGCEWVIYY